MGLGEGERTEMGKETSLAHVRTEGAGVQGSPFKHSPHVSHLAMAGDGCR